MTIRVALLVILSEQCVLSLRIFFTIPELVVKKCMILAGVHVIVRVPYIFSSIFFQEMEVNQRTKQEYVKVGE